MKLPTAANLNATPTTRKLKESSVHKKRKKRKGYQLNVHETSSQISKESQQTTTSSSSSSSSSNCSTMSQNRKKQPKLDRHKLQWPLATRATLPTTLLSIIIIKQLLCDMAATSSLLTSVSAASDPEPSQIRFQLDNVETTSGGPRFLEEPSDTYALEGQREVSLRCVMLAGRAVPPSWSKANRIIALGGRSQGQKQVSVTLRKQRPPPPPSATANATTSGSIGSGQLSALSDNGANLDGSQDNSVLVGGAPGDLLQQNSSMIVYNYTLTIANVSVENEGQYQCGAGVSIQSQRVWLRVLRPPAKLEVFVRHSDLDLAGGPGESQDTPAGHLHQLVSPTITQPEIVQQQQVVEVRHEAQIRLECRSSRARPRAELVWLDGATGRQLAPRVGAQPTAGSGLSSLEGGVATGEDTEDPTTSSIEELISANDESNTLVWSFKVRRDLHHLRVFTCRAKHAAYELMGGDGGADPSTRSVQLSVVYAPEVEVLRDTPQAEEGAPLNLKCQAHARPPVLTYAWLVDGQLLEGAHEPELHIANMTRQLHMREIRCQANNSIGSSSASLLLGVRYAPAYVTHLMPASLQPDYYHHSHQDLETQPAPISRPRSKSGSSKQRNLSTRNRKQQQHLFEANSHHQQQQQHHHNQLDPAISRELAYGAAEGENVALRCDFDAQPAPAQLEWFRIVTDYESMANVLPSEADDLIEAGANHARFKSQGGVATDYLPSLNTVSYHEDLTAGGGGGAKSDFDSERHNKRHIYPSDHLTLDSMDQNHQTGEQLELATTTTRQELDFSLMSSELLHEMEQLRQRQLEHLADLRLKNSSLQEADVPKYVEPLAFSKDPRSDQQHDISEPLALQVRHPDWRVHLALAHHGQNGLARLPTSVDTRRVQNKLLLGTPSATSADSRPLELMLADSAEQLAATSLPNNNTNHHHHRQHYQQMPIVQVTKPRKAQVVSTQIHVLKFGQERAGRYVCKATNSAGPGATETAKSIFLVLRQRPRLVSIPNQFAPLGALPLQVECLAQVNTAQGNLTQIQWFRDDKLIDVMHGKVSATSQQQQNLGPTQREKSFSIVEQLSPDGLFMRSRLQIHGAEVNDFGKYNCTVTTSLGRDTMIIELKALAPTGFAFAPIASLTLLLIGFFSIVVCLLLFLAPCRRLDSTKLAHAKSSTALLKGKSVKVVANDEDDDDQGAPNGLAAAAAAPGGGATHNSKRATSYSTSSACSDHSISSRSSLRKSGGGGDELDCCGSAVTQRADDQAVAHFVSAPLSACGQIHGQRRPESALSSAAMTATSFGGGGGGLHSRQLSRASLRSHDQYQMPRSVLPAGANSNNESGSPTKTRFAAIHESLESKLQFGSQPTASCDTRTEHYNHRPQVVATQLGAPASDYSVHSQSSPGKRTSLIDRIKSRFHSGGGPSEDQSSRHNPVRRSLGGSTKRPTISMPIKRQSLSNSLTQVNQTQDLHHDHHLLSGGGAGKHLMMAHLNGAGNNNSDAHHHRPAESHLISSSANLIQDNGTSAGTSDGGTATTTSSGRSSSTSNHHNHLQHHSHPTHMYPNLAYNPNDQQLTMSRTAPGSDHYLTTMQHPHQWHAPVMTSSCDNGSNLYANGPYDYQPQLYANESPMSMSQHHQHHHHSNPYGVLGDAIGQQQVQVVAAAAPVPGTVMHDQYQQQQHYQMPLMMSEPYLAAAVAAVAQQQQHLSAPPPPPPPPPPKDDDERPCYATICNGISGKLSHQMQQQPMQPMQSMQSMQHQVPLNGFRGMMNGQRQPTIMVPTSDGGDAYFESNYGTLLSQSSAYKTLGYYQQQQQQQQVNNHCHESSSSNSSTPNSLTTHANISGPPRLQTLKFTCPAANLSTSHHQQTLLPKFYPDNNKLDEAEEDEEEEEVEVKSQVAACDTNNDCQQQQQQAQQHGQTNRSSSPHESVCQESIGSVNSTLDQQQQQQQQHAVISSGDGQGPVSHVKNVDLATNV